MAEKTTSLAPPETAPKRPEGPGQQPSGPESVPRIPTEHGGQSGDAAHASNRERIRPRLRVSQLGDADEVEADRVADQIVSARERVPFSANARAGQANPVQSAIRISKRRCIEAQRIGLQERLRM